ncbi:IclR family transcriptional regulator [Chelatococcus reniformis]|uniref:Transcriptional regulator n=1 Tax=Chelatococcus reniformis TaxID=1494448 RepID=A0A916UWH4_9HYPH|nr:helix-turn-helix domain-containing protein [Chelatococcus reniformis]GGC91849.1 transcriptional regulator [Chelatococcus reniformis]
MGRPSHKIGRLDPARAAPAVEGPRSDDRDFVQVVARALDVMRCFDGAHALLGNQDIASITGLPKSTVSRLTYTLTRVGYLAYDVRRQAYQPGDAALAVSSTLLRGLEARAMIREWLDECAAETNGTWGMTLRDRLDMVFLETGRTNEIIALQSTIGSRVPLASTAAGRCYLLSVADSERERLLQEIAAATPEETPPLRLWLEANADTFARDGYAVSCGAWKSHISGVALSVFSPAHSRTFIFSVTVLSAEYGDQRLRREVAPRLLALGERVRLLADSLAA